MNGDWLDRAARAADERISRRAVLRRAGAGTAALALGPLGALLRPAPARADSPCLPACFEAWTQAKNDDATYCLKAIGLGVVIANLPAIGFGIGCTAALYYKTARAREKCLEPNCGGTPPPPPPPPGKPQDPPPPPPPLTHPQDERLKRDRKKKKPYKKAPQNKKKPPPQPDPCKDCAAVGAKCCPSSRSSSGFTCCAVCCSPTGNGCGSGVTECTGH